MVKLRLQTGPWMSPKTLDATHIETQMAPIQNCVSASPIFRGEGRHLEGLIIGRYNRTDVDPQLEGEVPMGFSLGMRVRRLSTLALLHSMVSFFI